MFFSRFDRLRVLDPEKEHGVSFLLVSIPVKWSLQGFKQSHLDPWNILEIQANQIER